MSCIKIQNFNTTKFSRQAPVTHACTKSKSLYKCGTPTVKSQCLTWTPLPQEKLVDLFLQAITNKHPSREFSNINQQSTPSFHSNKYNSGLHCKHSWHTVPTNSKQILNLSISSTFLEEQRRRCLSLSHSFFSF